MRRTPLTTTPRRQLSNSPTAAACKLQQGLVTGCYLLLESVSLTKCPHDHWLEQPVSHWWHKSVTCYTLQPVVHANVYAMYMYLYMQMNAAKRRLSGPARTLVTSLGWRTLWTVDDVQRLIDVFNYYLFILPSLAYDPEGIQKNRSITKL